MSYGINHFFSKNKMWSCKKFRFRGKVENIIRCVRQNKREKHWYCFHNKILYAISFLFFFFLICGIVWLGNQKYAMKWWNKILVRRRKFSVQWRRGGSIKFKVNYWLKSSMRIWVNWISKMTRLNHYIVRTN